MSFYFPFPRQISLRFIPVRLNDRHEVFRAEPDGGRILIGMHAGEPRRFQKIPVQEKFHLPRFVIEEPQRRHRAGKEPQNGLQIACRGEGKRPQPVFLPKRFQITGLIAAHRDEVIAPFLVIPNEKIFPDCFRPGQFRFGKLRHIVHGFMLRDLIRNAGRFQPPVNFFLIHVSRSFHSLISKAAVEPQSVLRMRSFAGMRSSSSATWEMMPTRRLCP